MPTVGTIIPCFNRADKLRRALRSVAAQSQLPEQVVVVDDASENPIHKAALCVGRLEVLRDRLSVVRLMSNSGPAAARQEGLLALETTYVAFLDSDDVWRPDKLEKQMMYLARIMDKNFVALSCGWTNLLPSELAGATAKLPRPASDLQTIVSGCWYNPGSSVVLQRSALKAVGGFDVRLRRLEDLDLFIRLAMAGMRLEVAPFVGVEIEKAANASSADVKRAANLIAEKFGPSGSHVLETTHYRRLCAWLEVERAVVARNSGDFVSTAFHLMRSQMLVPRLRIQLEPWTHQIVNA